MLTPLLRQYNDLKAKCPDTLLQQYNGIKAKYPDALLLFRVGDFYETFGPDAAVVSQILGTVLVKNKDREGLTGFPHHALDSYLPKLVRAGHRVAICDQLEDPKTAKSIVKRGVTDFFKAAAGTTTQGNLF